MREYVRKKRVKLEDDEKKVKKIKPILRAYSSIYPFDSEQRKILNHLTGISKNIYNTSVFCTEIYYRYKQKIYEKLYELINSNSIRNLDVFYNKLFELYEQYYKHYQRIYKTLFANNKIIYNFISTYFLPNELEITRSNYANFRELFIFLLEKRKDIIFNQETKQELLIDIIDKILRSFYDRKYFRNKRERINHKPFSPCDRETINDVADDNHYFGYNFNKTDVNESKKLLSNRKIISKFISNYISPSRLEISRSNYLQFRALFIFSLEKNPKIKFTKDTKKKLLIDQINIILKNSYERWYLQTKNELQNNKPFTTMEPSIIEDVKNDNHMFVHELNYKNFKNKIDQTLLFKNNSEKTLSDQNVVARFTTRHLGDNLTKLPQDVIINIIKKSFENYCSYFELKKKGIKCSRPKYLPKNGHFNLFFYSRSKKEEVVKNQTQIRLTVGNNIARNYKTISENNLLISLNSDLPTDYQKYVNELHLKPIAEKIKKSENFIIGNKFIGKNDPRILNAYYMNVIKPSRIKGEISMVEIRPLYDGFKYKVCYTYSTDLKIPEIKEEKVSYEDSISIDGGMKNLLTIHDPTGEQKIIKGKYLYSVNRFYGDKIDLVKSDLKKRHNKNTSNRMRKLLIKRAHKIEYFFNNVVKWLFETYAHKKEIILGYNLGWKSRSKMKGKANRDFQMIPYRKLIDKITLKAKEKGIKFTIQEESYTSVCDALAKEEICCHEHYLGKRIKRGLFKSSTGNLINADLDGAINIMRKDKDEEMKEIKGISLLNPMVVNILVEMNKKLKFQNKKLKFQKKKNRIVTKYTRINKDYYKRIAKAMNNGQA